MTLGARRDAPAFDPISACGGAQGSSAAYAPPDALLADVYLRAGPLHGEASRGLLARLQVAPADRILELGVGSGRLLAEVAARATRGFVAGVEPAPAMLRHAARRNARLVARGRVELRAGSSADLSAWPDATFDKVYGMHVTCFWRDPGRDLREVARVLRPGGLLVLGYWPDESAPPRTEVSRLEAGLRAAGLGEVRTERAGDAEALLAWTCARRRRREACAAPSTPSG